MATSSGISVVSIAEVPWSDVETVFGTRGDPSRCWCQFFKMPNAEWWKAPEAEKRARLQEQVTAAELYHGSVSIFEHAGFTLQERPYPGRALMSLAL